MSLQVGIGFLANFAVLRSTLDNVPISYPPTMKVHLLPFIPINGAVPINLPVPVPVTQPVTFRFAWSRLDAMNAAVAAARS